MQMQIILSLSILYALAGILVAIPFCLLAGWSWAGFIVVAFLIPAFILVWGVLAIFAGVIEPGHLPMVHFNWRVAFGRVNHQISMFLFTFWTWTLCGLLPVILHWSACIIRKGGYETVSSLIDTHRYLSVTYILTASIVLLCLVKIVTHAWKATKNAWVRVMTRRRGANEAPSTTIKTPHE